MTISAKCFRIGAVLIAVLMVFPEVADARGGRGGGISRGGQASSGSFTGRSDSTSSSVSTSGQASAGIITRGRPSATADQPRDAGSARGARSAGGASSSMGAGQPRDASSPGSSNNVVTRASDVSRAAPVKDASPEDMARYRQQFNRDNNLEGADEGRWDSPRPVDPDYGVPVRTPGERVIPPGTVATGAVLGTAIARENAEDYVNSGPDDYYTELPCSLQGNAEVDGSKYYKCSNGWYKRVYRGDDVVYVQVDAPPGM